MQPKSVRRAAPAAKLAYECSESLIDSDSRNGKLAPRFSAYEEHERGTIDAAGRKLRRVVYRWNGRFYS
jgi:hypothetical protein